MELKNITELETQYPTDKQIDKKELKKNIPTKWTKLGLTAFMFELMISNRAFAEKTSFADFDKMEIVGGAGPIEVGIISTGVQGIVPQSISYLSMFFHGLSVVMAIITIIQSVKFKINKKKNLDEEQLNKSKRSAIKFAKITAILILIYLFFEVIVEWLFMNF